jgi:hypothetical protein
MRRKLEATCALLSKALAIFFKPIVWTLLNTKTYIAKSFNLANFTFPYKWVSNIDMNSLFLLSTLTFTIGKMSSVVLL